MANKKKYDWDALENEFIKSNISLKEFAKRKEMSYRYLGNKASQKNWHDKRDELQSKVREEVVQGVVQAQSANISTLIADTPEKVLLRSKQVGDRLATLYQGAMAAGDNWDIRELKTAVETFKGLDDQIRKAWDLDNSDSKVIVDIQLMAALPSGKEVEMKEAQVVEG